MSSPLPLQILLLLISISIYLTATTSSDSPSISSCAPTSCGPTNITYPFWISASSSSSIFFCGYPFFSLLCVGDTPTLRFPGHNYSVLGIDSTNRTFTIRNSDIRSDHCPKPSLEFASIPEDFPYQISPQNANLIFSSNCTSAPRNGSALCLGKGSYVSSHEDTVDGCGDHLSVPVLQEALDRERFDLGKGFGRVLMKGFLMEWKQPESPDCRNCEAADGRCGYQRKGNTEGLEMRCLCKDKDDDFTVVRDAGGKKNDMKKKVIIGVVSLLVGFLLAIAIVYLWFRRRQTKKIRSASRNLLFQSTSVDNLTFKDSESFGGTFFYTPIFTYEELECATGGFDHSKVLGDGGFGIVYKGTLKDGRVVAVKHLHERNYRRVQQFRNEVEILSRIHHPNLVSLYGCTTRDSPELLLVYEFIPNGTVADHLHGNRATERLLTWPLRLSIAAETADALAYLHSTKPQIIHRDVKTSNLLLDNDFHVKVADFGLSRLFPSHVATHVSTAPQGTPGYVDPEYHQCYQLTDKSDVYSFGVVLVELISSMPAVDISRPRSEINLSNMAMVKIPRGHINQFVDPTLGFGTNPGVTRKIEAVAELAFRCLQPEKDLRPSMNEVKDILVQLQNVVVHPSSSLGEKLAVDVARLEKPSGMALSPGSSVNVEMGPLMHSHDGGARISSMAEMLATDDAYLLKRTGISRSPDSVVGKWASRSTTPNASS